MKSFRRVYAAQCRSVELLGAAEKIPKGKARDDMVKQVKTYQLGLKALGKQNHYASSDSNLLFSWKNSKRNNQAGRVRRY